MNSTSTKALPQSKGRPCTTMAMGTLAWWRGWGAGIGWLLALAAWGGGLSVEAADRWRVAVFEQDITIPPGHACMGGGIKAASEIVDPLWARGLVLDGPGQPIVVVALDWCQCNNEAYDRCRAVLAEAARTAPQRVLLATVHQHDAPIFDLTAQRLLDAHGGQGWICDPAFFELALRRTADALRESLGKMRRVTRFGCGQARVEQVASNRRVARPDGTITWERGSNSGDKLGAPEGQVDPWLKTISLWDEDKPVVAWSSYAVHPMSTYGAGKVSADFPGLARARRQKDDPRVFQIYFTGCAGDVTAGKYNDGSPTNREVLAERLYQGMLAAWKATRTQPLRRVDCRTSSLFLLARSTGPFSVSAMQATLASTNAARWSRIQAALGLSWRQRVGRGVPIEIPCLDLGNGQALFTVLPAESFVGYQLAAQRIRQESFVMAAGFGDGAPGYIPGDACWKDGYEDSYCWASPMSERVILQALGEALRSR